ncbi:type IV pilus modification protein PilV [Acinetobacter guillouiae]|uniref:type IV pilus modification protein PilV n=1 Tax=Acinetobacter guillouiae TaxID=106649 RepID=UPI003AF478F7
MKIINKQTGVGMVEVLVALVLLAIGVLGFAALQLKAVEAGEEALLRSQATLLLRGLTESIRANPNGQSFYPAKVQSYAGITSSPSEPKSCIDTTCTAEQMATYDAFLVAISASNVGINITMATCPGIQSTNRQCLFAGWNGTKFSAGNYTACMNSSGIYVNNAKCLMMEAY